MTGQRRSEASYKAFGEYLDVENLRRAVTLGAVLTALSIPRIVVGGLDPLLYVPAAFMSMTFVCGATTAWSKAGGMLGMFPPIRVVTKALGLALILGLACAIPKAWILDRVLHQALLQSLTAHEVSLYYPEDAYGIAALIIWVGSFETLFFEGCTMSLWSRITGKFKIAMVVTVLFRMIVVAVQMNQVHLGVWFVPMMASYMISQAVGCWLFARGGLLPAMLFNMGLQADRLLSGG